MKPTPAQERMRQVFEQGATEKIKADRSYIQSYQCLVEYFSGLNELTNNDLIRGMHMVYGWMPTILHINKDKSETLPDEALAACQKAMQEGDLSTTELKVLKAYVNRSIVGASKLLHFLVPDRYPIWDLKICRFVHGEKSNNHTANNVATYDQYVKDIRALQADPQFPAFHRKVEKQLGYSVSGIRALELVMFLNGESSAN